MFTISWRTLGLYNKIINNLNTKGTFLYYLKIVTILISNIFTY